MCASSVADHVGQGKQAAVVASGQRGGTMLKMECQATHLCHSALTHVEDWD
jgi:hypothetical protein